MYLTHFSNGTVVLSDAEDSTMINVIARTVTFVDAESPAHHVIARFRVSRVVVGM